MNDHRLQLIGASSHDSLSGDDNPHDRIKAYTRAMRSALVVEDHVEVAKYIDMIDTANREALILSDRDSLTGLMRRKTFEEDYGAAQAMLDRNDLPFAMMFVDIDNFKNVNENYGHLAGDAVLKEVANRMSAGLRTTDGVYRHGGDEFAAICSGVNLEGAILAAQNTVDRVSSSPVNLGNGDRLSTSISAGVYMVREGDSFDNAYKAVDRIMYNAKDAGKNKVSF